MLAAVFLASLFATQALWGWGPEGHRVVGALALEHMAAEPRLALEQIMDGSDPAELSQWCNWPDEYRATDEGAWTAPLHYINMVPGENQYSRERDCADGMCVTEAIREYATVLGDATLSDQRRREAFGYLCHFVGDLSQPLHAGFGHDRGGNDFAIRFHGEDLNLHEFWDHSLIELHTDSWEELYAIVHQQPFSVDATPWNPNEVVDWTNASHALAAECAYPNDPEISGAFAQSSWSMIQRQLARGGVNLARALNTVLALESGSDRHGQEPATH